MTTKMIFDRVQSIFQDIFDDDSIMISLDTSADDIEDWDSLNHINLVSAIEQEFKVRFTLVELISLNDVGEMIDLISEKLN
jgi:acyl carrier protein